MQFKSTSVVLASAIAGLCASITSAAPIVIKTSQGNGADAGIREDAPEGTFGDPVTQASPTTELTVRATGGQNRLSLVRFDLTGLTPASIGGFADLRLTTRNAGIGGTNAGGLRIYGLNAGSTLANWNETQVHYRDGGTSFPTPVGSSVLAQPAAGPRTGAPTVPFSLTDSTWGANAADPTRAPGIKMEYSPYSPDVETANQTAYTNNLALYNADIADDGLANSSNSTAAYTPYTNQQAYGATTFTGLNAATPAQNRPMTTYNADIDATATTFLGFLDYDAKATARPAGTELSFSTTDDNSLINHGYADVAANRAAMVAFLTTLLASGETSVTFIISQKNNLAVSGDNDPLPIRSDNLIFAPKEFDPGAALGGVGAWAPKLVLAPEPTSLSTLALGGLILGRRRKA